MTTDHTPFHHAPAGQVAYRVPTGTEMQAYLRAGRAERSKAIFAGVSAMLAALRRGFTRAAAPADSDPAFDTAT